MCVHYVYIVWIAGLLCLLLEEVWSGVVWLDRRFTQGLGRVQTTFSLFVWSAPRHLQVSLKVATGSAAAHTHQRCDFLYNEDTDLWHVYRR